MSTVLAIPDCHAPFHHKDAWRFLAAVKSAHKPNKIVCLGDEADMAAISMHDHDPDGAGAGDELKAARAALKAGLYKLFPVVQSCTSNHTSLPYRRAFKHGLPRSYLRDYGEFLEAPAGWSWSDTVEVDGVIYQHGEGYSGREGAIKAAMANMQSTVIGHLHSHAGCLFYANAKHLIFGLNVGCLIDRHAYPFKYAAKQPSKPVLGCGIVRDGIPTFQPMFIRNGRWTGAL